MSLAEAAARPSTAAGVVDACIHVAPGSRQELEQYVQEPWRSRPFPSHERHVYARTNEYWSQLAGEGMPGSNPQVVARDVFERLGAAHAVLLPLGRGLLPSTHLSTALCAATNDWLVDRYLADGRFSGAIRIDPRDPDASVREIERWAGHPSIVAVGVPTQSLHPYGHPSYLPIWRAAARHGLTVMVHTDGAAGTDFPPTSGAGYQRLAAEYQCLLGLNFSFHLASLFAEGTFRWVEDLRVVFADGGYDALWPIIWRIDKDWRGNRGELPAATAPPATILGDHVRFVLHRLEGPPQAAAHRSWLTESPRAAELLMFASNYPHWDAWSAADAAERIPEAQRQAILADNARRFLGIPEAAA